MGWDPAKKQRVHNGINQSRKHTLGSFYRFHLASNFPFRFLPPISSIVVQVDSTKVGLRWERQQTEGFLCRIFAQFHQISAERKNAGRVNMHLLCTLLKSQSILGCGLPQNGTSWMTESPSLMTISSRCASRENTGGAAARTRRVQDHHTHVSFTQTRQHPIIGEFKK